MKKINEFYNSSVTESLEDAKDALEKLLKKYTQGFEIYIDDSGKKNTLIISVDELIKGGAEYPDLDKAINTVTKKYKLKRDKDSNDNVVFLTESVSDVEEIINEKMIIMFGMLKKKLRDAAKLIKDPSDREEFYKYVKDFIEDKTDIEIFEEYKVLQERATSKAQRRLFAIALQYKRGNIEKSELEPEFAEEIIKLSELPEKTLKEFAKTKEKGLPHYVDKKK